ncbi:MAG TPA: hypothetical protein ENN40_07720, partial [Candidatus Aminicenantes bacterium]|nr:hypothetical protein [Candidatus Aminicenantes bacterium]
MQKLAVMVLISLTISTSMHASRIRGYVKSFALTYSLPEALSLDENNPPLGLVANHLRLTFTTRFSQKVSVEAAWDLSPT